MSEMSSNQSLIDALAGELKPVRRLPPPTLRSVGWLLLVALAAAALVAHFGLAPMLGRFAAAHDLGWELAGSLVTMLAAVLAAFQLAVPGRARAWVWLPLPPLALWIGACGAGCLRDWVVPGMVIASASDSAAHCLSFIIAVSIPLSALLVWMLRRACPLRPTLTAVLVGLASSAASASLLAIFHPFDAAATDLLIHALAVGFVVGVNALLGGRLLTPARRVPGRG